MNKKYLAIVAALVISAVAAVPGAAAAQSSGGVSSQDIAARDQLIANQENLLNTYRCLFNTDTAAVPGGCPDPDTITPAAAPPNPPPNDLDHRDQLIQNQEALLNTYRCQHNIDTQLVPGGCPNPNTDPPKPDNTAAVRYTAIAAGDGHSCATATDGTTTCGGTNQDGQADPPAGTYTAISASGGLSCGLAEDRTFICWGRNIDIGEDVIKDRNEFRGFDFTAISAGGLLSCGLAEDRTITCWASLGGFQGPPAGAYTAISAGGAHSCAIPTNGTITCWGNNIYNHYGQADPPAGAYTAISAGLEHSCAIATDGTITCWGKNEDGQADAPTKVFTTARS